MVNFRVKRAIQRYIDLLALTVVHSFYPTAVAKYDKNLSMENIITTLNDFCETGELELFYEIQCPGEDGTCGRVLDTVSNFELYQNQSIMCDLCGEEFEVDETLIIPIYKISDQYREVIKDESLVKKKKKAESLLVV